MTYRTPLSESDKFWNYISIANDIFPWGMRMTMNDDADNTDYDDYQGFWAKLFVSTDNTDDAAGAADDDDDFQAFRAKGFLSTDDGSGEKIVRDKAGDGEWGDIHETVVG